MLLELDYIPISEPTNRWKIMKMMNTGVSERYKRQFLNKLIGAKVLIFKDVEILNNGKEKPLYLIDKNKLFEELKKTKTFQKTIMCLKDRAIVIPKGFFGDF